MAVRVRTCSFIAAPDDLLDTAQLGLRLCFRIRSRAASASASAASAATAAAADRHTMLEVRARGGRRARRRRARYGQRQLLVLLAITTLEEARECLMRGGAGMAFLG